MFSVDIPLSEIKEVFTQTFDNFILSLDENFETYNYLLKVISKAILFDISKENLEQLASFVGKMDTNKNLEIWRPDKVIGFLLQSRVSNFQIPSEVLFPSMYTLLEKVLDSGSKSEAEEAMKVYLDNWYDLHKTDPWYNNHKKQRGYSGYWCWEAAAIVKIMKLDDTSFKDHPHYPYDMVHWQD